ncbi:MAG: sigma-70 family RNA polymerase sigma factor [Patescibacteria group bacterium]
MLDKSAKRSEKLKGNMELFLKEACEVYLLRADEELELARMMRNGDNEARERLINANLRLVVTIANKMFHWYKPPRLTVIDLTQEGSMAIVEWASEFDPERGNRFSTFIFYKIFTAIRSAILFDRRTNHETNHFDNLASETKPASLDHQVDEEENILLYEKLREELDVLPDDEREIIELFHGLNVERSYNSEEIAKMIGMGAPRVRGLMTRGLKRLKGSFAEKSEETKKTN